MPLPVLERSGCLSLLRSPPWQFAILLCAALLLVILFASRAAWLPPIGRYLVKEDPLRPASAIVPLAGDPQRVVEAVNLYHQGYAPLIILTPLPLPSKTQRENYVTQNVVLAFRADVLPEAIEVIRQAGHSTYDEAINVRAFAAGRQIDSIIVVTSPWHTRRSRLIFREVFEDSRVDIIVRAMSHDVDDRPGDAYRPNEWWTYRHGWRPTLSEYLKLLAHFLGIH